MMANTTKVYPNFLAETNGERIVLKNLQMSLGWLVGV